MQNSKKNYQKRSEWLLFNGNSAILQLYHGEEKLHYSKMIITYSNNNGRTYYKKSRIFWPLCFLFFFDIRILIAPLVSSNSSYNIHPALCKINIHRTSWMYDCRINNDIYHHSKINFTAHCVVLVYWHNKKSTTEWHHGFQGRLQW